MPPPLRAPSPTPPIQPGPDDVPAPQAGADPGDQVVDAVLGASRVLVAVAARSLADLGEDVSLAQYRALVVLASRGPQRVSDLAEGTGVGTSTATRMCDRLVRKQLVRRHRLSADRRAVQVALTQSGRELVAEVTRRRRAEITSVVCQLSWQAQLQVVEALRAFAAAAGEVPEQDWSLGWGA